MPILWGTRPSRAEKKTSLSGVWLPRAEKRILPRIRPYRGIGRQEPKHEDPSEDQAFKSLKLKVCDYSAPTLIHPLHVVCGYCPRHITMITNNNNIPTVLVQRVGDTKTAGFCVMAPLHHRSLSQTISVACGAWC